MFAALGDRVRTWMTLNEPRVVMDAGCTHAVHPPAHGDWTQAPRVAHNLLRAHGLVVRAFRAEGASGRVGMVVNLEPKYPASTSAEDLAATARAEAYMNRFFLDPLLLGSYPAELPEVFGEAWPEIGAGDMELIAKAFDILGINYYTRSVVRRDDALPLRAARVRQDGAVHTELDWEV